jgi:hypothetical protein
MLKHIEMLLLAMQDEEAWSYTRVMINAIESGEY